jgi:hypothetical protein
MWDHPAACALGRRDVIGAWLVCLALAAGCLALPPLVSALDRGAAPALINPPGTATVAAEAEPEGSCEHARRRT